MCFRASVLRARRAAALGAGIASLPVTSPSLQAVIDRIGKTESDVGQALRLPVQTLPQPDETTCGPTCLHAVYRYWGDTESLDTIIARMCRCYVMEVNDNPNIDAGNEDGLLKEALYREVLGVFLRRIRERGSPVEA
jgi:hypothetical protein